ncbi:hypothetical protein [Helicobacter macacae]|uniref:hypothetical protein n=1 Tax=Helicobacter macacae TaxID=398626 RepID=UPI00054CF800|nr:hypothetical protein [Helicobacter macacae]
MLVIISLLGYLQRLFAKFRTKFGQNLCKIQRKNNITKIHTKIKHKTQRKSPHKHTKLHTKSINKT